MVTYVILYIIINILYKISFSLQICYGKLEEPQNPLLRYIPDPESELCMMLDGYEELERSIGYKFRDRSYLLQAFTHASYQPNRLTDCYQRLEFLGDAVLGERFSFEHKLS